MWKEEKKTAGVQNESTMQGTVSIKKQNEDKSTGKQIKQKYKKTNQKHVTNKGKVQVNENRWINKAKDKKK